MDSVKYTLKVLIDVMYSKGILTSEEYEAFNEATTHEEIDDITDVMLCVNGCGVNE